MVKVKPLILFLAFAIAGCATPLHVSISSIKPEQLDQKGMIVGHFSYLDCKTKGELGGFFGPNFRAYATRVGDDKKVYEVWIENKDQGYFGWLVEPGTYWVHGCRIWDANQETSLCDFTPNIEVKAGEMTYIGHINVETGQTHFGKTVKKIFSSGIMENLRNQGVLVEAEQTVTDDSDGMKTYLQTIGLGGQPVRKQLIEAWKYAPK